MRIKQAKFVISVADKNKCYDSKMPEIAIAGKSNVGKSSFINYFTNIGRLAKTSSEPGRTRLLNYFEINNGELMLVDLPGYGYARVSDAEKEKWSELIGGYLTTSPYLCNVFVLVDIRHVPSALDKQMIAYLHHYRIPFTVIATKCDKLSKAQINKQKSIIAKELTLGSENIYPCSAMKKTGLEAILNRIDNILEAFNESIDAEQPINMD